VDAVFVQTDTFKAYTIVQLLQGSTTSPVDSGAQSPHTMDLLGRRLLNKIACLHAVGFLIGS
jgi:hypothetical protein